MKLIKKKKYLLLARIFVVISFILLSTTSVLAEQYETGMHAVKTSQGVLSINVGYVSHFNAFDFLVYSYMYQPKESKVWHQVPYIENENDPKLIFNVQTKHTSDTVLLDSRVASIRQKIFLFIGKKDTGETLADVVSVNVAIYELTKLDDYERWVFIRKNVQQYPSKTSIENALDSEIKKLAK